MVPRGVPLRVDATGGVAVDSPTVTAPGTITVRSDRTRPTPFEFVFTGAKTPAGLPLHYELRVAIAGGAVESETTLSGSSSGPAPIQFGPVRGELRCAEGPVELRWDLRGVGTGSAIVDTSRPLEDGAFRVEIPVGSWDSCVDALRVLVSGEDVGSAEVVTERGVDPVPVGREVRLSANRVANVAAVLIREERMLVADPIDADTARGLALTLVPAGTAWVHVDRPPALQDAWPLTVERSDGVPLLSGVGSMRIRARARIDGDHYLVGPFPVGDVELVFRLVGREIGRRTVTVRANETVHLAAPPIVPPERR